MEVDESIVQLREEPDAWWDEFSAMLDSEDSAAQGNALLRGIEIAKEFDRLKADGLRLLATLLDRRDTTSDEECVESLLRGFEFGAKLKGALHDELMDPHGQTKVAHLMHAIANALDGIGSGRVMIATLLDHPDARVRASAGAYLINLVPERAVPVLREIEENEHANSAHFTAYWALLYREREGKAPS
jgi:hypothetical protein